MDEVWFEVVFQYANGDREIVTGVFPKAAPLIYRDGKTFYFCRATRDFGVYREEPALAKVG